MKPDACRPPRTPLEYGMAKKHTPETPKPPAAPVLPDALRDFIKAVTPTEQKPAAELTARFKKQSADESRGFIAPGSPKSGPEYFVELRIREWMYRMEREAADRRKQSLKDNAPPKPPKP